MTDVIAIGQLAIGAIQAVAVIVGVILVSQGLRQMRRSSDLREKRDDQRHAESMEALRALIHGMETVIARTAPKGDSQ